MIGRDYRLTKDMREAAAALKRASLERQLAGEETYTQQDLVELALEPWLKSEPPEFLGTCVVQ